MSYGFQLDVDPTTAGYGIQPYGTSAYGGGGQTILVLPDVHVGSDDPEDTLHRIQGESRHARDGVVIGNRVWAERKVWRLFWKRMAATFVTSIFPYYAARVFRFIPNVSAPSTYYRVIWLEADFPPPVQRGRTYDVELTLQEVPS